MAESNAGCACWSGFAVASFWCRNGAALIRKHTRRLLMHGFRLHLRPTRQPELSFGDGSCGHCYAIRFSESMHWLLHEIPLKVLLNLSLVLKGRAFIISSRYLEIGVYRFIMYTSVCR
ncbi:hypothetical protein CEXT_787631 [Caerostris extrusa]|uniref:Uncharacterized protein n=1 Tax=Caerostris extrusa TaxID=172846 RepID=A0AAV4NWV7_CAEEX|nr:hypothetical protein CEXT_787631 [Caerostris extrusa]